MLARVCGLTLATNILPFSGNDTFLEAERLFKVWLETD